MAEKVIKEHYVPQRYLRHFATNEKFFVYDKEKKESRPGNVGDYACERFFYDVDFDAINQEILENNPEYVLDPDIEQLMHKIDEQHLEHWLGRNVETWLFDPLDRIISNFVMTNPNILKSVDVLSEEDMNYISLFLAIQSMRSKEFREQITELYERLPKLLMKKFAKTQEERNFADLFNFKIKNENYKKLYHAQFLTNPDIATHMSEVFRNKLWMVGYNLTNTPLVTSDNPIVKFGHKENVGFNSNGVEIFFPINTNLVLIMKDPAYFYYESTQYNRFIELDKMTVDFINSLQVQQSYRCVFSKDNDFKLVQDMMDRNPALSNIKHKRFLMG